MILADRFATLRRWGWIALLIGGAAFLGWTVANEYWLLLLPLAVLPLLAMWPIPLAFGAYAFLIPFDAVGVVGGERGGAAITFFVGGLAGGVLLLTGYLRRRLQRPPATALWWLMFVLWGGLTCLWAADQDRALTFLPTAVGLLFLYLAASSVRLTRDEFSWIVWATILGGCVAAAYSCSQYSGGIFYHGAGGRSSLMLGDNATDPNAFAASLFLPLSLVVGKFLESRGWRRILHLAMGGLIATALTLTMSRGAMLGVAAMIFIYIRRLGLNRRVLIPIAIVLVSLLAVSDSFMSRWQTAGSSGGAGRIYIWEVGLASLKEYGLFGVGLHNFSEAYTKYVGEGSKVYSHESADAHNVYLLVAVELGIVGLGLMGKAVYSALQAGRRLQDRLNQQLVDSMIPYEAAAWAMLTSAFFVGMLWRKTFWMVWILYALAVRLAQEKAKQPATADAKAVRPLRPSALSWSR